MKGAPLARRSGGACANSDGPCSRSKPTAVPMATNFAT